MEDVSRQGRRPWNPGFLVVALAMATITAVVAFYHVVYEAVRSMLLHPEAICIFIAILSATFVYYEIHNWVEIKKGEESKSTDKTGPGKECKEGTNESNTGSLCSPPACMDTGAESKSTEKTGPGKDYQEGTNVNASILPSLSACTDKVYQGYIKTEVACEERKKRGFFKRYDITAKPRIGKTYQYPGVRAENYFYEHYGKSYMHNLRTTHDVRTTNQSTSSGSTMSTVQGYNCL